MNISSCVFISLTVLLALPWGLSAYPIQIECLCSEAFNTSDNCYKDIIVEMITAEDLPILDGTIPAFLYTAKSNVEYIYNITPYTINEFSLALVGDVNNYCYDKNPSLFIYNNMEAVQNVRITACNALNSIQDSLDGYVLTCLSNSFPLNKDDCLHWDTQPDPTEAYNVNIDNIRSSWNDYISTCLNSTAPNP